MSVYVFIYSQHLNKPLYVDPFTRDCFNCLPFMIKYYNDLNCMHYNKFHFFTHFAFVFFLLLLPFTGSQEHHKKNV